MVRELVRHMFPRSVPVDTMRITYTFCLGGIAFTCLLVLAATGLLLLFYYSPSPASAHGSIQFLESSVWGGAYLRSLHRMASHALLLLLALHTLRVIATGAFQAPRRFNWVVGCLLLFLCIFEAYTGYLLPMDQLAYWATQTGMDLLKVLPLGGSIRQVLVPDSVGGPLSLLRFYALHVAIIPISVFTLSMIHFFVIRRQKGILPYL
ncbi:MAG: cytochrome b N-terminal domain-containing protein [Thermoanaerobaculia bacterium]